MIYPLIIGYFGSIVLILGWSVILHPLGLPLLPIGALAVLPMLYFSWREALFFILTLTLCWESGTPLPWGWVAIPLTAVALGLQLLARHQLRGSLLTQMLGAFILQSLVAIIIGIAWPPRTIAGMAGQMWESSVGFILAAILGPLLVRAFDLLTRHKFNINLESRLKDL